MLALYVALAILVSSVLCCSPRVPTKKSRQRLGRRNPHSSNLDGGSGPMKPLQLPRPRLVPCRPRLDFSLTGACGRHSRNCWTSKPCRRAAAGPRRQENEQIYGNPQCNPCKPAFSGASQSTAGAKPKKATPTIAWKFFRIAG